eukprot:888182-Karenia_brevis.AAC.1
MREPFVHTGGALHKQTREPLGRQPELCTSKNLFGNATRALQRRMTEPLGAQGVPCTSKRKNLWEGNQSYSQ